MEYIGIDSNLSTSPRVHTSCVCAQHTGQIPVVTTRNPGLTSSMAVQSNFEKQQNVRSWCLTLLDPAWESENWPMKIVDEQLWDVICPHDSSRQLVKIMCGKIIDRYSVVKDICLSEKHNEIDKCVDILFKYIILLMMLVKEKCDRNHEKFVAVFNWLKTVAEALAEH